MEAWLLWTPMLRLAYSEEQMFGVYLHGSGWLAGERGAGRISRLAFGKDLNDLSMRELDCLEKIMRGRIHRPQCPETNRFLQAKEP